MQCVMIFVSVITYSMQQSDVDLPSQCVIIQNKQTLVTPPVPDFLKGGKTMCQQQGPGRGALQCGNTNVFIKHECVCTFFNVIEAKYHDHTACPNRENSDDVKRLTCRECVMYSLHNKGPCINGGNLTCKTGDNVIAPNIQCDCPHGYKGMFCENIMEKVTRICDRIEDPSSSQLINCDLTKMDCITYSESKHYAFKCNKTEKSQERKELPLCNEIEFVISNTVRKTTTEPRRVPEGSNKGQSGYTSGAKALTIVLTIVSVYCRVINNLNM